MGLAAAVIGAGALTAGASVMAANSTKNAVKDTAAQNNALQSQTYESNKALLTPFIQTGQQANAAQASFVNGAPSGGASGGAVGTTGSPVSLRRFPSEVTVNGKAVPVGSAPPANPTSGSLWVDVSSGTPMLHAYDEGDRRWATAGDPAEQKMLLGGQTLDAALSPTGAGSTVAGPTNPGLQQFSDSAGLSGPRDAIAQTLGTSEADFLARTGQDKPTQQLSDLYGGSEADYGRNTGQGQTVDQIKSQLGDNFGAYKENAGVQSYNDAIDQFLGVGAGGFGDYLKGTGYDFTLKQGLDAATQGAAAKGMLHSGSTLKALQDRGAQVANTYGEQYLGDLRTAAGQREAQGQNYLTELSNLSGVQRGMAGDYASGVGGLAGLKGTQAANYTDQQRGLYNLDQNAFSTYWGSQGDLANRGAGSASSLAGVGQNYASSVNANNTNALTAAAGANATTANSIGGVLGNALGAYGYMKGAAGPAGSSSWTSSLASPGLGYI